MIRRRPLVRPALVAALTSVVAAAPAPSAGAATPRPFDRLDCVPREGTRFCEGTLATRVPTFDGVPLDVNVTLPGEGDGPWPLVIALHGFGSPKRGFADRPPHEGSRRLAQRGIAVLAPQARGVRGSCGSVESRLADPVGCARGWLHLDDLRFEIRDAQYLAGLLADQGIADPQRIGAFADSYGGQPTLMLGLLRDRMMLGGLPGEEDGKLVPWTSPRRGLPMRVRAVAPYQTWSDLPNVLLPNGRVLDYAQAGPDTSLRPPGVVKAAFIAGLLATGQAGTSGVTGYFAPPGADPESDLTTWAARLFAGEPYDDPVTSDLLRRVHATRSPVVVPLDREPAAMILASGWADDLFEVTEMLRIRSAIQDRWPRTPIGVYLADFGHQRTSNEQADVEERNDWFMELFDHYLLGKGPRPGLGFRARPVTCPTGNGSGPQRRAPTWAALHPGEVRLRTTGARTVRFTGGDPGTALEFTPVTANDPCKTVAASPPAAGSAAYRLPAATGEGYTVMGAATVVARLAVEGTGAQLVSRLWDVAPDGRRTLLVRGAYRPRGTGTPEPFQLAPAGWRVAPGHALELELLGADAPHFRPSNGAFAVTVADLDLRVPVADEPGSGPVTAPAPPVFVDGARPAADVSPPPVARGRLRARATYPRGRGGCGARAVRVRLTGAGTREVRRMVVRRGTRVLARDVRTPFSVLVERRRAVGAGRRAVLRVQAVTADGAVRTRTVTVRFC